MNGYKTFSTEIIYIYIYMVFLIKIIMIQKASSNKKNSCFDNFYSIKCEIKE